MFKVQIVKGNQVISNEVNRSEATSYTPNVPTLSAGNVYIGTKKKRYNGKKNNNNKKYERKNTNVTPAPNIFNIQRDGDFTLKELSKTTKTDAAKVESENVKTEMVDMSVKENDNIEVSTNEEINTPESVKADNLDKVSDGVENIIIEEKESDIENKYNEYVEDYGHGGFEKIQKRDTKNDF